MGEVSDVIRNVLRKCEIALEGNIISREDILRAYAEYLCQTIEKRKHNVGAVYHSGSLCFDAILVALVSIANLIYNETNTDDVIANLNPGSIVLYGINKKERYIFEGFVDGGEFTATAKGETYIKLTQKNGEKKGIPDSYWRYIEPYNGSSLKLDGRGIKKKGGQKEAFYKQVLQIQASDIPNVIDTSTVFVMQKDVADRLIKGITIKFGTTEIRLLELVTASYYTEEEEHPYGGNAGKHEPVLKICAKISVARKLLFARGGNRQIGLVVSGNEIINRGESELPELINRKSLQYVYLCSETASDFIMHLLDEQEDIEPFACTKHFLEENMSQEIAERNRFTIELNNQLEIITKKANEAIVLDNLGVDFETYKRFKKTLISIKRNQYTSVAKDDFIIQVHSLMNLLLTAPFSMNELKKCAENGLISVDTVENKIARIKKLAEEMSVSLNDETDFLINTLQRIASEMISSTPKERKLRELLYDNIHLSIAIVVPKAYYSTVISEIPGYLLKYSKGVDFWTVGRFDSGKKYDLIIVLGNYEGKRFNAFCCNSSKRVISLLYESEEYEYHFRKARAVMSSNIWDKKSTIRLKNSYEEEVYVEEQTRSLYEDEIEINSYVSQLDILIDPYRTGYSTQNGGNQMAQVVAVATFADDSKAFFSKNYLAYVLDSKTGTAVEKKVSELDEGDSIVFTKNTNDTKDIVDSMLRQMISDGKLGEKQIAIYNKSKEWKRSLLEYMQKYKLTAREVANNMSAIKAPVQETTIIGWLDEASHTVGPQKIASFRAIGVLTSNKELRENPELFSEACVAVRKIRRRILTGIGMAIFSKLSGAKIDERQEFSEVYDKIDLLADVLQIERIIPVDKTMPLYVTNRPLNI